MKNKLQNSCIGFLCLLYTHAFAAPPNDDCANATTLTVGTTCSTTAGTTASATESLTGCKGNANDDVWYKFVANNNNASITVVGSSSFDPVVQLFDGGCAASSLQCVDNNNAGGTEIVTATGLSIGTTYYLRVYDYYSAPSTSTFTICVTSVATPANDNCAGATLLSVVSNKNTTTAGTSLNATQSLTSCNGGTADDDVWYKFTANATKDSIYVYGASFDAVVEVFTSCGGTSLGCTDGYGSGSSENVYLTGLTIGQTYYIRVYHYWSGSGSFVISVYKGTPGVVSGTEEASPASKLNLYPNPAKNDLNLDLSAFDAEVTLEIVDAKGNKVLTRLLNAGNESTINVEGLENGVYMAKISSGNRFSTERFVIMK